MMFFGTIFFGGGMLPDEAPLLCVWLFSPMLVLCLGEVCCSCLFLAFVICDKALGFVICVAVMVFTALIRAQGTSVMLCNACGK